MILGRVFGIIVGMKKSLLVLGVLAASSTGLLADAYTWTGSESDGLWFTPGNWLLNGETAVNSPGNAPAQDVVIANGDTVTYVPGGDWLPSGSTTVSGGSTLVQSDAAAWPNVYGPFVLDGGTYDTGGAGNFRLGATMTIRNGGVFTLRCTQANTDGNGRIIIENGGTLTRTGEWTGVLPVAMTGGVMTVQGVYTSNEGDTYAGGAITATGEFHPLDGLVVDGTVFTCSLYAPQGADRVTTFNGGGLVCTSSSYDGYFQNAGVYIDIPAGSTATFTMPVAASSVYSAYFASGKFRYAGEAVAAEDFANLFTVDAVDASHARFYLTPTTDWKIGELSASGISSSGATVSTSLAKTGEGAFSVYVACDTDALTEGNVVAKGEVVTANEGVYSKAFTGLVENTAYNYAFAIVTNGAVAAFKSASFVASDYEYIYNNGWVGGNEPANLPASVASILFVSDFTTAGELRLDNKCVVGSTLTSGTMLYGTLSVVNSVVVNTRKNMMNQAPYGFYGDLAVPLDFVSRSGNGTVSRACSYTFRAVEEQLADFKANVIDAGKIKAGGEAISSADYTARFTLETAAATETDSYDYGDGRGAVEATLFVSTLTMWDVLPAATTGAWTFKDGARVKLAGNAKLSELAVETGDVKIDLNGCRLAVSSLTVGGVRLKGQFTSADLAMLVGDGTLVAGSGGLVVVVR